MAVGTETDRARVRRCRWSLPIAARRCCCCHRCCQLGAGRPVACRPALCRGWPAAGPGRLPPGPWFLTGVPVETPGSGVSSRGTLTRHFPPVLVVLRAQPFSEAGGADTDTQQAIPGSTKSDSSFVRHCHRVGWRRSPGNLLPSSLAQIGECRMSLRSALMVSSPAPLS